MLHLTIKIQLNTKLQNIKIMEHKTSLKKVKKNQQAQQEDNQSLNSQKTEELNSQKHTKAKKVQKLQNIQKNTKQFNSNHLQNQKQTFKVQQKTVSQLKTQTSQLPARLVQILAVSDNHGDYSKLNPLTSMKGDIFIHAGDFTYHGRDEDFHKFFDFIDKMNGFKHKIVISGNHQNVLSKLKLKSQTKMSRDQILQELKKRNCIYLENQSILLEGIKIYASPYTPEYCQKPTSRAFQYKPSSDTQIWSSIPLDTQLLITHGPPYKILDLGKTNRPSGSAALSEIVRKIKPKFHIFGHIHESKGGMYKQGPTTFLNLCNTPSRFSI